MLENPAETRPRREGPHPWRQSGASVGIVSTSSAGLHEVSCLLAREGVGLRAAICVSESDTNSSSKGSAMLAGLGQLQADSGCEVIALIACEPSPVAAERILAQVRDSDKPTVIGFPGINQRLVGHSGAIPAARLDEIAMRAAAWVRGWDQALISSRLKDLDEQLAVLAKKLGPRLGPARHQIRGLFSSRAFCCEAQLVLARVLGDKARDNHLIRLTKAFRPDKLSLLENALVAPNVMLILLDVVLDMDAHQDPATALAAILREHRDGPTVIAHVCGPVDHLQHLAEQEGILRRANVILAASNAQGIRLAGMLMLGRGTAKG